MKLQNRRLLLIPLTVTLSFLASCHDDDNVPYPSLITEMADCLTNADGVLDSMMLDDDTRLGVTNAQADLHPNAIYRCLVGYTLEGTNATLYSLRSCPILRDSTAIAVSDPLAVVSLWQTRRYINLHLFPMGQEFKHHWGYITDSIQGRHAFVRLHHRQGNDPLSYSSDVYASLPLDSIDADTLTLRINTFTEVREWTFTL